MTNAYDRFSAGSYVQFEAENPYFDFINRAGLFGNTSVSGTAPVPVFQSASMFSQCVAKGPSLVTVWIGNNDVLGGATAGTVIPGVTITDVDSFDADYKAMLLTLAGGLVERTGFPATMVVANIPSISDIPYFWPTAVFNATLPPILGGSWPLGFEEDDVQLVRFTAASWLATANPAEDQIPASYTLSGAEVGYVNTAVTAYNNSITAAVAMVNGLGLANCGLVDANSMMANLEASQKTHFLLVMGQILAGQALAEMDEDVEAAIEIARATTLFSLDGIHPNNAGYALIAEAFLDEIETLTGETFDPVPAQTWNPTYGHPGTPVDGKAKAASVDSRIDGAMSSLFR